MVNPTLMPDTVKGYCLPRKVSTPFPPPTPTMKPPLVKTTATWPVSAKLGVADTVDAKKPSAAASIIFVRYFFITLPFQIKPEGELGRAVDRSILVSGSVAFLDPSQRTQVLCA